MIKSLPKEIQEKLRSGIAIFSLQQCVEELVLNGIDAGATCVAVKVDIEACRVQVLDNGAGMSREDLEGVGTRYCTSKCSSLEDLDNLRFYGFRGEAIASIASIASLVEITSRTNMSAKTFVKRFNEGKDCEVFEAETSRPSAGTTMMVCNIFHSMPVRRKRMDSVLEMERIRQRVEAISLMHPSISFTVKKECSGTMMVQLPKARNTYYRFVQIHGLGKAQKLREVNFTHRQFEMTGYISCEGHYNSSLQFLFVNSRFLLKTRIHKLLGCLLRKLSSNSTSPNTASAVSSPKQRSGADLHGVYIINIKCHYSEYDVCLEPAKSLIEFQDWDGVLFCMEEGVKTFLQKENLVSELTACDIQNFQSVFSGIGSSLGSKAKTPELVAGYKSHESDLKDVRAYSWIWGTVSNTSNVQEFKSIVVSCSKETGSDSDTDRENPNLGINKEFQNVKQEESLKNYQQTPSPDVNDNDSLLGVPKTQIKHCENSKISLMAHQGAHDSLRRFADPDLICAPPKRKWSLIQAQSDTDECNDECGSRPKTAKVGPHRKLTLAFETGSLDQFKRKFEKGAEAKVGDRQVTDHLHPADCGTSVDGSEVTYDKRGGENHLNTSRMKDDSFRRSSCNNAGKKSKTSLAAKLSRCVYASVARYADSHERLADSHQHTAESSHDFSRATFPNTGTSDPAEVDLSEEPIATLTLTSSCYSTEDAQLASRKNTTSPEPGAPCGRIVDPASQPDLLPSKTGNEEQSPNENQGQKKDETNSDWIKHYDESLGKMVYVNQVTGLSKYDAPPLEETQVSCSTDVTNMAVSLISKTGFDYRCYPFQTGIVLPFLPKPRAEREISSGTDNRDQDQGPSSLSTLFSEWNNPVFLRPPQVAVDVTSGQAEGLAVKIHNILFPYRFTKDMMQSMKVIHQVDKKFLACLVNTAEQNSTGKRESEGSLLVLVDQHAAHERVRLEGLVTESYEDDPDTPGEKRLSSSSVCPPLEISVTEEEMRLLRLYRPLLRGLALEISFPETEELHVLLERLPSCFIEKECTEQRRGRRTVIKSIAEEYLREQIEFLQSTGRVRGTLPLTVHNVLASQACHGAIKFNNILSKEECCTLVASLSSCQLPFQCAHGRPSMVPLVDLLHLEDEQDLPRPNLRKLRRMYKAWQLYGNK